MSSSNTIIGMTVLAALLAIILIVDYFFFYPRTLRAFIDEIATSDPIVMSDESVERCAIETMRQEVGYINMVPYRFTGINYFFPQESIDSGFEAIRESCLNSTS